MFRKGGWVVMLLLCPRSLSEADATNPFAIIRNIVAELPVAGSIRLPVLSQTVKKLKFVLISIARIYAFRLFYFVAEKVP